MPLIGPLIHSLASTANGELRCARVPPRIVGYDPGTSCPRWVLRTRAKAPFGLPNIAVDGS
eukprot:3352813-Pyramimonas_sp.AAC.1